MILRYPSPHKSRKACQRRCEALQSASALYTFRPVRFIADQFDREPFRNDRLPAYSWRIERTALKPTHSINGYLHERRIK